MVSEHAVCATGLTRSFRGHQALAGVDLQARYGEVTGLVGPNGAGKTTLLLVLATLLRPDGGRVEVAGFDPARQTEQARANLGWVPDAFGVYDNLTAREYLSFAHAAYRLAAGERETRVGECLELARLAGMADTAVHVLSRGQKQRLGIARALIHQPKVLLLDEPAAGLDPTSRIELRRLVRELAGQGTAVVLSSHILADLEETADRVVFLEAGRSVGERAAGVVAGNTGRRSWRLRALDQPALVAALDAHGYARGEPGPIGIDVDLDSDAAAAALIAGLVRDGVALVSCAPVGSALEAAYLQLTGSGE